MKLNWAACLGAAAGLSAALVLFAPAKWLASGVSSVTSGQVLLDAPRGTVWSGSAQLVLAGGAGSAGALPLPSRLGWQLTPTWLGAKLALQAPCCISNQGLQLDIALQSTTSMTWQIAGQIQALPAQLLSGLGSPWNTLQLAGNLGFQTQKLAGVWSFKDGLQSMTGSAQLEALQLQTALSTVRPLGSYKGVLTNSQLILQTANPEDALQLTGTGELVGKFRFQGEAVASSGKEAALSNLLHIIGQRQTSTDGRLRTVLTLGQP